MLLESRYLAHSVLVVAAVLSAGERVESRCACPGPDGSFHCDNIRWSRTFHFTHYNFNPPRFDTIPVTVDCVVDLSNCGIEIGSTVVPVPSTFDGPLQGHSECARGVALVLDNNSIHTMLDLSTLAANFSVVSIRNNGMTDLTSPPPGSPYPCCSIGCCETSQCDGESVDQSPCSDNDEYSDTADCCVCGESCPRSPFRLAHSLPVYVDLSSNMLESWNTRAFTKLARDSGLTVSLANNRISTLPNNAFHLNYGGPYLFVDLSGNEVSEISSGAFNGFGDWQLYVDLSHNRLASLDTPYGAFSGMSGAANFAVNLQHNNCERLGALFADFQGAGGCYLDLSHNLLTAPELKTAVTSYTGAIAPLTMDLLWNNLTMVPSELLGSFNFYTQPSPFAVVTLNMPYNPITYIAFDAFSVGAVHHAHVQSLTVDVSHPTNGSIRFGGAPFDFGGVNWANAANAGSAGSAGSFTLKLDATGIDFAILNAVGDAHNTPPALNVAVRYNGLRSVHLNASVPSLTQLDLSGNRLSILTSDFASKVPFAKLTITDNSVWAMPTIGNHVQGGGTGGNMLSCTSHSPKASGCRCAHPDFAVSIHCGFTMCTQHPEHTAFNSTHLVNASDCSSAPFSAYVSGVPNGTFYDATTEAFTSLTDCSTAFTRAGGSGFLRAFEYRGHTPTTDRQCSICSTCPQQFDITPCTATSNTNCTRHSGLSPGDIAAIVLSLILFGIAAAVGAVYGRRQSTTRARTQSELSLTERLLGDVQTEKDRIEGENSLMEQGWAIAEGDLAFGESIGEGAFGRVFRGMWGHIPVAIKVLRYPLDELDPMLVDDFNREVQVMRSIRHPHLLTFYGAGIDAESRAFLVTELMAGSLKPVLLDHSRRLDWPTRLAIASDVAKGVKYLHDKGMVHRDLKADNCFVDDQLRAKVADFGTGRILSNLQQRDSEVGGNTGAASAWAKPNSTTVSRTLSSGVGSMLWMAPEVLRGSRITEAQAPALDVYSYAIVLWEIWARGIPWDEIQETGAHFSPRLGVLVNAGTRPRLPEGCGEPPNGYRGLMERCWAGRPESRPTIAAVVEELAQLVQAPVSETPL